MASGVFRLKQARGSAADDKASKDSRRPKANERKSNSSDQPGAVGQSTAGAEEDTYD